jgi:hypothetical protein
VKNDHKFRLNFKGTDSARTIGLIFRGGVVNFQNLYFCKNKCGSRWNYEWLYI